MLPSTVNFLKINNPSPISDIQSDNKSLNQKLCISFQCLMKKQQIQQSTRNTEWSHQEKSLLTNMKKQHKINHNQNNINYKRNNKEQNIKTQQEQYSQKSFKSKIGFKLKKYTKQQQNLSQNSIIVQSEQKNLASQKKILLQNLKKSIINKREQKINRLKSLLPYYYTQPIPLQLKSLLKVAQKIDTYLIQKHVSIPSNTNKKFSSSSSSQYIQNIHNILRSIFENEQLSIIWSCIKKILFLAQDYYKIKIDPLKNLCISFGVNKNANAKHKNCIINDENMGIKNQFDERNSINGQNSKDLTKKHIRKEYLRKIVIDYYLTHKQYLQHNDIPQAIIEPVKISRFYPENTKITQKYEQKHEQKKNLKPQFIHALQINAIMKQNQVQNIEKQQKIKRQSTCAQACSQQDSIITPPILKQLDNFCKQIENIFISKKVKNMYKVSLIENLRLKSAYSFQKIFTLLKYIINEGLFLEVKRTDSGCQILKIRQQERIKLIKIFVQKIKTNNLPQY